jgi:hypothetical protein
VSIVLSENGSRLLLRNAMNEGNYAIVWNLKTKKKEKDISFVKNFQGGKL